MNQQSILNRQSTIKQGSYFVPRLLLKTLEDREPESKVLMSHIFCEHLKVRPSRRELLAENKIFPVQQNQPKDKNIWNLISKIKKKNTTVFQYISKCQILNIDNMKKLFSKNKMHVNFNMFSKPERCEQCFGSIQESLLKSLLHMAIIYECLQSNNDNRYFFIEKEWFHNYYNYLTQYSSLSSNSFLHVSQSILGEVNNCQIKKGERLQGKTMMRIPGKLLLFLLEIYNGQIAYSLGEQDQLSFTPFSKRKYKISSEGEILISLLKENSQVSRKLKLENFYELIKIYKKVDLFLKVKLH